MNFLFKRNSSKACLVSFSEQVIARESSVFWATESAKGNTAHSTAIMQCVMSHHCWVKRQEITDSDKMMRCWEFYQIHSFTLVMAVILVQCHCAHQLYILSWMLNLYLYHFIIIETQKLLIIFFGFITWFPQLPEYLS